MAKTTKKNPKGAGRKEIELDWNLIESLAPLTAELNYIAERTLIADGLPVDKKTLEARRQLIARRIQKRFGCDYLTYRNERMELVKAKLINKAYNMAFAGNVQMLMFCLKNLCGWVERKEFLASVSDKSKNEITLNYKLEDQKDDKRKNETSKKIIQG